MMYRLICPRCNSELHLQRKEAYEPSRYICNDDRVICPRCQKLYTIRINAMNVLQKVDEID